MKNDIKEGGFIFEADYSKHSTWGDGPMTIVVLVMCVLGIGALIIMTSDRRLNADCLEKQASFEDVRSTGAVVEPAPWEVAECAAIGVEL